MNLLVMSISSKVPLLKSIRTTAKTYKDTIKVYGTDSNDRCIGRYFVDYFWQCPALKDLSIDQLLDFCVKHHITMIIPTRDGELIYFAQYKETLKNNGIHVMVSCESTVQICLDKLLFSNKFIEMGYPVIPSYIKPPSSIYKYVVKERFGAGSSSIGINLSIDEAIAHAAKLAEPIYQPYIEGAEYSVDVYVSSYNKVKGIIVRKREVIVSGESQVTTTVRMPRLEGLIKEIVERLGFCGHVMFQVLIDSDQNIHIIECNCRIGGASTLSFAVGLNSVYWFIAESFGTPIDELEFNRSQQEKTLIRHAEDLIIENSSF